MMCRFHCQSSLSPRCFAVQFPYHACPAHASVSLAYGKITSVPVTERYDSLGSLLAELLDSDTVHVHGALLGQALAHGNAAALLGLVLGLADEASLLELLKAVSNILTSGQAGVLRLDTTAGLATEVLAESLDANLLPHVELVANGSCACVKPVIVQWVELLVAGSLNGLGPLYNLLFLLETARIEID